MKRVGKTLFIMSLLSVISFSKTVFADIPTGTIVIGDKAFSIEYVKAKANEEEIRNLFLKYSNEIYIKTTDGKWIDNRTKEIINKNIIPEITYKNEKDELEIYEKADGICISKFIHDIIYNVKAGVNNVVIMQNDSRFTVNTPAAEQLQISDNRPDDALLVIEDNESEKYLDKEEIKVSIHFKKGEIAKYNQTDAVSAGKKTKFENPVEGNLLRAFNIAETDKTTGWGKVSHGIDITAKLGAPVIAADAGSVEFADISSQSLGVTVVINHNNGLKTVYSNLAKDLKIKAGDKIEKGQEIGKVGDTALTFATEDYGPHLHFQVLSGNKPYTELIAEMDIDQVYVNPAKYVDFRKVKESQDKKVEDRKTQEKDTIKEETDVRNVKATNDTIKELDKEKTDKKKTNKQKVNEEENSAISIEVYEERYVVEKGDTLFSIARKYLEKNGLDEKDNMAEALNLIKLANKDILQNANEINIGTELLIPTETNFDNSETPQIGSAYTVQVGESLIKIAEEQMPWCEDINEAVELIKANNDIEDENKLVAGATIYIPLEEEY